MNKEQVLISKAWALNTSYFPPTIADNWYEHNFIRSRPHPDAAPLVSRLEETPAQRERHTPPFMGMQEWRRKRRRGKRKMRGEGRNDRRCVGRLYQPIRRRVKDQKVWLVLHSSHKGNIEHMSVRSGSSLYDNQEQPESTPKNSTILTLLCPKFENNLK